MPLVHGCLPHGTVICGIRERTFILRIVNKVIFILNNYLIQSTINIY